MAAKLIASIKVEKLFGLYTYHLPETNTFSNAAILYGDNGVGKSTVLRLAFHLLSAADNRGHRNALYSVDFQNLEVELVSGILLSARFQKNQEQRILTFEVSKHNKTLAVWDFHPKGRTEEYLDPSDFFAFAKDNPFLVHKGKPKASDAIPRGHRAFLEVLSQYVPTIFILNADRRLDSDSVPDPSDEMELRRVMRYEEPKQIGELVGRSREIALSQAMSSAAQWVWGKSVMGTNQGSMNVHSVYVDVLQHVISPSSVVQESLTPIDIKELVKHLDAIEEKTKEYSRYELATQLSVGGFKKALNARAKKKSALAVELLKPYIKSLEGRLSAVEPVYQIVDRLVTIVNGLLRDKELSYKLSQGFGIQNKLGSPLTPAQLSSGEQQLLLLFCYVLTARERPSVFMIDEPEISLNIKWQRQLVQSLLDITEGADIQFIFASHSMELLAQHKECVVKLVSKK